MREIKFRAWNSVLNEYRKLDMNSGKQNLGMGFEVMGGINSNITTIYHSVGDVIEQYTGLKDKNGVEIYEGDAVSFGSVWDNGDNEDLDEEIHIGVVEYDPHYAVYNVNCEESGERRFLLMDVVNYDGFGVIGNKFENPELLEEKK